MKVAFIKPLSTNSGKWIFWRLFSPEFPQEIGETFPIFSGLKGDRNVE